MILISQRFFMKNHLLGIFIAGSLFAGENLKAQSAKITEPIDVSAYSPIRFNMETSTEAQRKTMNKVHHDFLVKSDPEYDKKRSEYEEMIQKNVLLNESQRIEAGTIIVPVVFHIVLELQQPKRKYF
jgi:hypothetical protein